MKREQTASMSIYTGGANDPFKDVVEYIDFRLELSVAAYKDRLEYGLEKHQSGSINYTKDAVEKLLKSRGYVQTNYDGESLLIKGFVAVICKEDSIIIFHDIPNSQKLVITKSIISHLIIALKYMERGGMGS